MILKPPKGAMLNRGSNYARGLVGCWLMNEGGGTIVNDLSGNGQSLLFDATTPPAWDSGKYGPCVTGVDDKILGTAPAVNSTSPGDMSVVAWYKVNSIASSYGIVITTNLYISSSVLGGSGWCLGHSYGQSPPRPTFWLGPDSDTANQIRVGNDGSYTIPLSEWVMVAATFDSATKTAYLYINGVYQVSDTEANATSYAHTQLSFFQGNDSHSSQELNGSISHSLVYNRALSATEMLNLYRSPFCMFEVDL